MTCSQLSISEEMESGGTTPLLFNIYTKYSVYQNSNRIICDFDSEPPGGEHAAEEKQREGQPQADFPEAWPCSRAGAKTTHVSVVLSLDFGSGSLRELQPMTASSTSGIIANMFNSYPQMPPSAESCQTLYRNQHCILTPS
jgi:hypothetical protein